MPPKKKVIAAIEESVTVPEQIQEKPKAKRSTAAAKHKIVAVVTKEGIQGSFYSSEPRKPIIVNLPIKSSDVHFYEQPLIYDPRPPQDTIAFNEEKNNPFEEEAEKYDNNALVQQIVNSYNEKKGPDVEVQVQVQVQVKAEMEKTPVEKKETSVSVQKPGVAREYGPTKLLVEFANTKGTKELPSSTSMACFWCCDTFTGRPCVIPMCIIDNIWHVYGNYCNPQCAMAALLNEPLDTHVRWERIALLNMLYGGAYANGRIYPAPDRGVLQRFGGPMVIEEFRELCERGRMRVDIHMPPLISIIASMDTKPIDFYESNIGSSMQSASGPQDTSLKLKRSKPLKEREHTLDNLLGLKTVSKN